MLQNQHLILVSWFIYLLNFLFENMNVTFIISSKFVETSPQNAIDQ